MAFTETLAAAAKVKGASPTKPGSVKGNGKIAEGPSDTTTAAAKTKTPVAKPPVKRKGMR